MPFKSSATVSEFVFMFLFCRPVVFMLFVNRLGRKVNLEEFLELSWKRFSPGLQ